MNLWTVRYKSLKRTFLKSKAVRVYIFYILQNAGKSWTHNNLLHWALWLGRVSPASQWLPAGPFHLHSLENHPRITPLKERWNAQKPVRRKRRNTKGRRPEEWVVKWDFYWGREGVCGFCCIVISGLTWPQEAGYQHIRSLNSFLPILCLKVALHKTLT